MPDFAGLLIQGGNEMRMGVTQAIDGDATGEIEIAVAIGGIKPGAFAPLESEVDARIGRQ